MYKNKKLQRNKRIKKTEIKIYKTKKLYQEIIN